MNALSNFTVRAYAPVVFVVLMVAAFVPRPVSPGAVLTAGLLLGGAFAIVGGLNSTRRHGVPLAAFTIAALGSAAWFSVTAALSANPRVSLMGIIAQHNGVAIWVLGGAWLLAAALVASPRVLRETLLAVMAAGLIFSVAAWYEVLSGGLDRSQDHAAAFFENSVSLGQFIAVALICAVAWILSAKRGTLHWIIWAIPLSLAWTIDLSDSRTGILAVAASAVLALATWKRWIGTGRSAAVVASVLVAGAGLLAAALVGASMGALGSAAGEFVARFGTGRDGIWRAAWARLQQSPMVGSGMEQFSTFTSWRLSSASFEANATTDPHSLALGLALGGGLLGLALAAVTTGLLLWVTIRIAVRGRSKALSVAASLPIALVAAGTVGWLAPAVMLAACAGSGAVIGAASSHDPDPTPAWATAVVRYGTLALGLFALALGALGLTAVSVEVRQVNQTAPAEFLASYRAWPDPAYAIKALQAVTPGTASGDPASIQLAEQILEASRADTASRVDVASTQLVTAQALEANDAGRFAAFEAIAAAGRTADPTSGFWDSFAAIEADRLGLDAKASDYAAAALRFPVPADTRAELEALVR